MDLYRITPITRKPFGLDLNSTDEEGNAVVFNQIKVALLAPYSSGPSVETQWLTLAHDLDGATLWIAGHDVDDLDGALEIPEKGAILWAYPVGSAIDPSRVAWFVYG
jgi:hypothetical protein